MGAAELLTHVLLSSLVAVTLLSHSTPTTLLDRGTPRIQSNWAGATRCYLVLPGGQI